MEAITDYLETESQIKKEEKELVMTEKEQQKATSQLQKKIIVKEKV